MNYKIKCLGVNCKCKLNGRPKFKENNWFQTEPSTSQKQLFIYKQLMPELQIILISSLKQAPQGPLLNFFKKIEIYKLYTFEKRNTFHSSPSANSDCPF